jgi:TolB protein
MWVVPSDGGKPRELVRDIWGVFGSAWSPDGSRLAVTVNRVDGADIFVVNPDRSGLTQITKGRHSENVSWSPDGKVLAFAWTVDRIDGPTWVAIANPDGTNIHRLGSRPLDGGTQWSPTGGQLGVDTYDHGIYVIDIRTGRVVHRFPSNIFEAEAMAWSPNRRKIVFAASSRLPTGTYREDLYMRDVQHSRARRLVFQDIYADAPAWSPDGKLIAFSGTRFRRCPRRCTAIFVVKPDGTGLRRLTPYSGISTEPAWSQSGDQIAYVGARSNGTRSGFEFFGPASIYVMKRDGTKHRRLHGLPEPDNLGPLTWQPSG